MTEQNITEEGKRDDDDNDNEERVRNRMERNGPERFRSISSETTLHRRHRRRRRRRSKVCAKNGGLPGGSFSAPMRF